MRTRGPEEPGALVSVLVLGLTVVGHGGVFTGGNLRHAQAGPQVATGARAHAGTVIVV